jgi:RNA polymerase sigma-70 factor (ECF subfamily)
MEDTGIIELYWQRNERAIQESSLKYGAYCHAIAYNILQSPPDAEECVNDTWMRAWNAMPPKRPSALQTFLGKITRNLSFDRYKEGRRKKRGGGETALVLDELAEIVSGKEDPVDGVLRKELAAEIDRFLSSLPQGKQQLFILRYWYVCSIAEISGRTGMSENNVSVSLSRIRAGLRNYLTERGYEL